MNITQYALDIDGIRSAYFWGDPLHGVIYDERTGQEYDVRRLRFGWNVNDDNGIDHRALTLAAAVAKARRATGEENDR